MHGGAKERLDRPRHFFDFKEFELIAFFNIVIAFDVQAALKTFFDFFGVVFEAFERIELAGEDHHIVAQQAQAGTATHHARGDHTACNRANFRGAEDLANLGHADDFLFPVWRQHAADSRFNIIDSVVDDVVVTDVDTIAFSQFARTNIGAGVEAENDRFRCDR